MNKIKAYKLHAGYYFVNVITPEGKDFVIDIKYYMGSKMNKWTWGKVAGDLFDTKKECILAVEEFDFDFNGIDY